MYNSAIIITVREHKSETYIYLICIFRNFMDFFSYIEQLKDKFCITSLKQYYFKVNLRNNCKYLNSFYTQQ